MALVISNSDNTFEGAVVFIKEQKFYAYKVNKKSIYIGEKPYKEVMDIKENLPKGYTFKKLMERVEGKMIKFGVLTVSEEEVARKDAFEKITAIRKNQKSLLNADLEKRIELLHKHYIKGSNVNFWAPMESGSIRTIILKFNEDRWAVLHINGHQFFYDLDMKIFIKFNSEIHKDGINILWPVRNAIQTSLQKAI